MPQFPSRSSAGGIYSLNAAKDAATGGNWPLPAPNLTPSSVAATQVGDDIQVSFTQPALVGASFNNPAPATNDYFGTVVSAFGNYVAVGVPDDDTNGSQAGTVYIYYVADGVYTLKQTIAPRVTNARFGAAIEIYNDTMVIGAPGQASVMVYTLNSSSGSPWVLSATLPHTAGSLFGTAVSTDGTWIAAATSAANQTIRVYRRGSTASTWNLVGGLSSAFEGAQFGHAVNIRNGHCIYTRLQATAYLGQIIWDHNYNGMAKGSAISTPSLTNGTPFTGALVRRGNTVAVGVSATSGACVGVYDLVTAATAPDWQWWQGDYWVTETKSPSFIWSETQAFTPPTDNINFGCALAMTDTELAIGADGMDVGATNSGAAYYYTRMDGSVVTSSYALMHTIRANTVQAQGAFGGAVAFIEAGKPRNYLWIGERNRTVSGVSNAGAVWTFNPQIQFYVTSSPGNVSATRRVNPISVPLSALTLGQEYTFSAAAWTPDGGAGASVNASPVTYEFRGSVEFTAPGTYTWVCPAGVTTVAAVAVGGGGGGGNRVPGKGGGALTYRNNISVTPGQSYTIVVGVGGSGTNVATVGGNSTAFGMVAGGGLAGAGNYQGGAPSGTYTGGFSGGRCGVLVPGYWYYDEYGDYVYQPDFWSYCLGAGGAAGYSGNGGNGGGTTGYNIRSDGAGGGGAGGIGGDYNEITNANGGQGGGVGIWGQGPSGVGASKAGSGGEDGGTSTFPVIPGVVGQTGRYGGGGNGQGNGGGSPGGHGAVRIIWGTVLGAPRAFPSTGAGNI